MIAPDPGSFRDPMSRVYVADKIVWRGLSREALEDYRAFAQTSAFDAAMAAGQLVGTEEVPVERTPLDDRWAGALRHDEVSTVTYPYEWSFSMLRDAALLQLDLAEAALRDGILIKDASSYNVQFEGSRPIFIDLGSFERLRPGEPWAGYRQFCELFLNPLYVQALADVPFQPLLRSSIGGITPSTTAAILGSRQRLRRDVLTHVRLHARAERRFANDDAKRDIQAELQRAGFGPRLIGAQLANLRRAVLRTEWRRAASTWSSYSDRGHYSNRDLELKASFVADAVQANEPATVLDLGANDGHFSRVAVEAGATLAIAIDGDHLVVDHLYRALRASGEERILPLVVDLADPSPGTGWRSQERAPLTSRLRPDLTLCLAVVHHLALTNTVPFSEVVELLHDLGAPLVVEFPHRDDPMATRLLARKRDGLFDHYDRAAWEAALGDRFIIDEQVTLPSGTRTLYRCRLR